ncbi:uncharacterized protein LOC131955795 isoform X2 [Physella acuta]|uniref:uncharacterized protein LOC131955795 isoform X2 n=1 Tax=Physella acuta TaxID=109671 RepID=UPI0027DC6FBB|nr:uncharacterized protein LOC131955795 isoform X2 [Physella acuta]
MEKQLPEKRKKSKLNKSTAVNVNDSSYGSLITGTSSSSSLSLSLFSESDFAEAPSTSGCSSEMASAMQSKEKKKERAKEFMKTLKSMLPPKERARKMDTLSTLEQLVNSMRQLNEEQTRQSEFKIPPPHSGSYVDHDSEKLSQSNMYISVTLKNHVVQSASTVLMEHLGYPVDWWKGRLLKDFVNKKDINTVNSCIALHSSDEEHTETSDNAVSSSTGRTKEGSKYFYARIRRFRKLGDGFTLHNVISYCPFMMMITTKPPEPSDSSDEEGSRHKKWLTIYCQPLSSAYTDRHVIPEKRNFSLRHSLFCNFTYVHPNAVRLLGFLPQDLNSMSIFELYHPDDFHLLLEIHKKIILSMGQPFKSGAIRLRTRNGCYVEVETEWSSFMNPWSMQLEFIIGQHTITKGPTRPDLFEDLPVKPTRIDLSPEARKIKENILEVLKRPIQGVFAEPSPVVAQPVKEPAKVPQATVLHSVMAETESSVRVVGMNEKPKGESSTSADSKSTVIDDKGISSIYNQLNYSHNIKRFLMSHPKSFSNVSDEDSVMTREDSEDEAINDDEEMPLEIPVVKPPSCGSSTQVHVSEQGHGEEMLSPPTFGDEAMPRHESTDNIHLLTEETLKKHTKLQERLYLQTISEEQPLLLNMRRIKGSRNASVQKRPRPRELGDDMELAKHPCTKSGVFRSSSNIFMQSFPAVTSSELTSVSTSAQPLYHQAEMVGGNQYDNRFLNQNTHMGYQPFPTAYPTGNQGPQPALQVDTSCIPTSLGPMIPNMGHFDIRAASPAQNIQWPFYPQTGYTLLPQVMTGFYRPVLQPVQVQTVAAPQGGFMKRTNGAAMFQEPQAHHETHVGQPPKKIKTDLFDKKNHDSDNPSSSMEDTTSSIMYLLEADSSTFEDSDHKASPAGAAATRVQNKRSIEPPWTRSVKWNTDTKMRYTMAQKKTFSVLKLDEKFLKKNQQSEMALACLEQLLEEISLPDCQDTMDEEADYLFYPGDETLDDLDKVDDKTEEVEFTQFSSQVSDSGGGGGGGGRGGGARGSTETIVWSVGVCDNDDESYDTPVNNSEDEKSPPTPTGVKEDKTITLGGKNTKNDGNVAMETVFLESSQAANNSPLIKGGSSPKDGSMSGDECSGSDGGQKAEMEDAQSNCSKVSSDLTPSDDRSNEEAGSSLKESDASTKKMKGVSSVASSNSSNDHTSQEEGSSAVPAKDAEDLIKKLFVPLKVRMTQRLDVPSNPYWLVEAHLSPCVAMTYKIPTRQLENVLNEDKRKMTDLVQSPMVKQQLLQLLNEVDVKSGMTAATAATTSTYTTLTKTCCHTSVKKSPSLSDSALGTMTEEDQSKAGTEKSISERKCSFSSTRVDVTTEKLHDSSATKTTETDHKTSQPKDPLGKSVSNVYKEKLQDLADRCKRKTQHSDGATSSDTNTDPVTEDAQGWSQCPSQSSASEVVTCTHCARGSGAAARSDSNLQERFQDMESSSLSGQKIEDIIMSKVFVPVEVSTTPELKTSTNIFSIPE